MKENLPDFVCSSSLVEAFCIYANNQMTKRLAGAGMLPENVEIHFFPKGGWQRSLTLVCTMGINCLFGICKTDV